MSRHRQTNRSDWGASFSCPALPSQPSGSDGIRIFALTFLVGLLTNGFVLATYLFNQPSSQSVPPSPPVLSHVGSRAEPLFQQLPFDSGGEKLRPRVRPLISIRDHETFEWLEFEDQHSDLILISHDAQWSTIRRRRMTTSEDLWTCRLPRWIESGQAGEPATFLWNGQPLSSLGPQAKLQPHLIRPAPDLDGDGVGDLVWHSDTNQRAFIIAISGASGRLLWVVTETASNGFRILSPPLVADVDQDGRSDVITCMERRDGSTWMEAIAGATGARHWRHLISELPQTAGTSDSSMTTKQNPQQKHHLSLVDHVFYHGQRLIVIEDDTQIRYYNLSSGSPMLAVFLPPGTRTQSTCFSDFDRDGESEAILFRRHGLREMIDGYPPYTISAWQSVEGRLLWDQQLSCALAGHARKARMFPVIDLDQNRRIELAVTNYVRSVLSLDLIDAMTGKSIWSRAHPLSQNPDASVGKVLVSPDVNGDGIDDLLLVSLDLAKRGQSRLAIYLDLLSGRDGESILALSRPLSHADWATDLSAQWLPQPNRFPLLAVMTSRVTPTGRTELPNGKDIDVWSLPDRELIGAIRDIDEYDACDLQGDGRLRLCVSRRAIGSPALSVVDFQSVESDRSRSSGFFQHGSRRASSYLGNTESQTLSPSTDPRWLEPLPWATMLDGFDQDPTRDFPSPLALRIEYLGIAQLAFLAIFLAPAWIVCRSLADRRWSLGRWLMLPAVVGIALVSHSVLADNDQTKELALLSGLPNALTAFLVPILSWTLLLLPVEIAVLLMRRSYVTVVLLLGIVTLLAILATGAWLLPLWTRMDRNFSFDWRRWHWIWLAAAYFTGWAYLAALAICHYAQRLEGPHVTR